MQDSAFDALSADEISRTSKVIRAGKVAGERPGFAAVYADEPDKRLVREGVRFARRARAIIVDRDTGATHNVIVDLSSDSIVSTEQVAEGSAPMLAEDIEGLANAVRADPRYIEALAKRGITDLDIVQIDPWSIANRDEIEHMNRRLWGSVSYLRHFPEDNGYAHPIEGLLAVVDMTTGEVVAVDDYGVRPMNTEDANYGAQWNQPMRDDVAPLEIVQPEGVGFKLDGPELTWQKWRFRVNVHPLEGLNIHGVEYLDQGTYRSVMHRGSLAEMVVPYGDPNPEHAWRSAFDAGEYGLGRLANPLKLGCDCLGEIVYLDAVFADDEGEPTWIKNAVCIHEEDAGILWKHTDVVSGDVDVRRSRRLVVSSIATVGNYHYGFYWNFYQDGSIEVQAKLLGIVQTRAVEDGEVSAHGTRVGPNIVATYHQHIFSFRLDMEIDGWENSVYQCDAGPLPTGPENPQGNAIGVTRTLIAREQDGEPFVNPQSARSWLIVNSGKRNKWGSPVGYKFLPGWASSTLIAHEPSMIAQRAQFATRNIWVTPYDPREMRSGGDYPNQNRSGNGLAAWASVNRPVENTDVVLWHTLGVTHIPRAEDWPVMPTEVVGFHLVPVNFFDKNPALDVPSSAAAHCGPADPCH